MSSSCNPLKTIVVKNDHTILRTKGSAAVGLFLMLFENNTGSGLDWTIYVVVSIGAG